jgi:preprotein translocase subunit SecD
MTEINKGDGEKEKVIPPVTKEGEGADAPKPDEQNPLKKELEKVQNKGEGRTKKEKLLYTKQRIEEQLREMEGEESNDLDEDDDTPVTKGMLREMQAKSVVKTALDLTEDISDDTEKALVQYHIKNTIRTTGNPAEDLKLARAIVNSVKNSQIAEEVVRKGEARQHSNGSGGAGKSEKVLELSAEELPFMSAPFNMTKEQIIAARPK